MELGSAKALRASLPAFGCYSSRIIKAGALLADTKTLLSHWDLAASVQENLDRVRRENLLAKASRSRVDDILAIFRQRYLSEEPVTKALVALVKENLAAPVLDRILYFHAARADRLLYAAVTELLLPTQAGGITDIDTTEVQRVLKNWVSEGKTTGIWSEYTTRRVTQGILSTLRDFGMLQGSVNKHIAPAYLPVEAFAYVVFYLRQHQASGIKVMAHPDWRLFCIL